MWPAHLSSLTPGTGVDEIVTFAIRLEPLVLSNTTIFSELQFQATEFSLRTTFSTFSFTTGARFTPEGLDYALIISGMGF
jgi:hypothetical protein